MKTKKVRHKVISKNWFLGVLIGICLIFIIDGSRPALGITTEGILAGDETWSGLVTVTGNVIVPPGITLTISPETVVEFNAGERLELLIEGTLIADGVAGNEITFTSNSGTPGKGDWTWIRFGSTGSGSITYSQIEYANTGIRMSGSSPTISNNTFSSNNYGINSSNSSSLIENNIFSDNDFGIVCNNSSSEIKSNRFYDNSLDGIDINNSSSSLTIHNNIFYNNGSYGMEIEYTSSPSIDNNTLYNNGEGALYIKNTSNPVVKNNLITDSANYGIAVFASSSPSIIYNDVWNNAQGDYYDHDTSASFSPSPGTGELSQDPLYVDPLNDDFHLAAGSPAIDAGDPSSDYANEPQPNGNRINMGAYGNTTEATTNDEDSDGLIDSWELAYFGILDQIGTDDPDGDGLDNEGEETTGTDPTNPDTDGDGEWDASDPCPLTPPVRIVGAYYYVTLQDAYDDAVNGDIIQSQAVSFTENLYFDLDKSIILEGGYNCDYSAIIGDTTINGNVTINDGTVTIDNFILQ